MTKQSPTQPTQSKQRTVLPLDKFVSRNVSLQKFQQRKQRKRTQTAQALGYYRAAMKKEGFTPGTGASRKRKHDDGKVATTTTTATSDNPTAPTTEVSKPPVEHTVAPHRHYRGPKSNPLAKVLQQASQKQEAIVAKQQSTVQQQQKRLAKLHQRRQKTHRQQLRTSKGQPILNQIAQDILQKLQQEQSK